jgi:hypothetical protein
VDDPHSLTVQELVAKLRADAARERKREAQARKAAERAEAAVEAIQSVTGFILTGVEEASPDSQAAPLEPSPDALFAQNGDDTPLGEAAVLRVMSEHAEQVWTPREVHRVLEARGWLNPEAVTPRAGTEAAINRLVKKQKLARLGRGEYAYLGGDRSA